MKYIIVACFLLVFYLFNRKEKSINRQNISLNYFKLVRPKDAQFDAILYHGIVYSIDAKKKNNLKFNVKVDFVPEKSYFLLKGNNEDSLLLKHEQGHADISVLNARSLQSRLNSFSYNKLNYRKKAQDIFLEIFKLTGEEHKRYDFETKHGLNKIAQEKWNDFFNEAFK